MAEDRKKAKKKKVEVKTDHWECIVKDENDTDDFLDPGYKMEKKTPDEKKAIREVDEDENLEEEEVEEKIEKKEKTKPKLKVVKKKKGRVNHFAKGLKEKKEKGIKPMDFGLPKGSEEDMTVDFPT